MFELFHRTPRFYGRNMMFEQLEERIVLDAAVDIISYVNAGIRGRDGYVVDQIELAGAAAGPAEYAEPGAGGGEVIDAVVIRVGDEHDPRVR